MKNNHGITLVELLAALALLGIILTLSISIFMNGAHSAERTSTKQLLQQEANLVIQTIRKEYLTNSDDPFPVAVEMEEDGQKLYIADRLISSTYEYIVKVDNGNGCYETGLNQSAEDDGCIKITPVKIERNKNPEIDLTILKDSEHVNLTTTLSKLQ